MESMDRRTFLGAAGAGLAGVTLHSSDAFGAHPPADTDRVPSAPGPTALRVRDAASFDPWIEVDAAALRANVQRVAGLAGGRPILAVVKNNAYGLGLRETSSVLEPLADIAGFAVVKSTAALALREWGVRKPILHMGLADEEGSVELARAGVLLSFYAQDAVERVRAVARATGGPVSGHVYMDTGMGRMGIPVRDAIPWLGELVASDAARVQGTFMAFTEETEFDHEQLRRFRAFANEARLGRLPLGLLHAASSNGVYHLPEARLDMVRPGIALFGAYPSRPEEERALQPLTCAVRLKARVIRTQQLRPGDGVSYGRNYVAERPTWTATLPVGHTDGYPRGAVDGAKVLIEGRLYPVIGAVSASHCIVEVGPEPTVQVGDEAVLLGPDRAEIEPNALAAATGSSVYDRLMHLNPALPRVVI